MNGARERNAHKWEQEAALGAWSGAPPPGPYASMRVGVPPLGHTHPWG